MDSLGSTQTSGKKELHKDMEVNVLIKLEKKYRIWWNVSEVPFVHSISFWGNENNIGFTWQDFLLLKPR